MKKMILVLCLVVFGSVFILQGCGSKAPPKPPKAVVEQVPNK